jgi:plasmid maintenance system antidote protein VapI
MTFDASKTEKQRQKEQRAKDFAEKLAATGLALSEFAKEAGLTRNVIYNLSTGQAPSSEEQAKKLSETFDRLKHR